MPNQYTERRRYESVMHPLPEYIVNSIKNAGIRRRTRSDKGGRHHPRDIGTELFFKEIKRVKEAVAHKQKIEDQWLEKHGVGDEKLAASVRLYEARMAEIQREYEKSLRDDVFTQLRKRDADIEWERRQARDKRLRRRHQLIWNKNWRNKKVANSNVTNAELIRIKRRVANAAKVAKLPARCPQCKKQKPRPTQWCLNNTPPICRKCNAVNKNKKGHVHDARN
jgi:predicted Zn-ribbon and HTH transcriptional regulator